MIEPRTVKQAETECRIAWEAHPEAEYGWCIHHDTEIERLMEPIENRIDYILKYKPEKERITRLDNLRPVLSIEVISARKAYEEATAPAGKVYEEATAPARKAYEEATAPAWKVFEEAIAPAHRQDVPNHTWNGKSIFQKG